MKSLVLPKYQILSSCFLRRSQRIFSNTFSNTNPKKERAQMPHSSCIWEIYRNHSYKNRELVPKSTQ